MFCAQPVDSSATRKSPIANGANRFVNSAFAWVALLGVFGLAGCVDVTLEWDPVLTDPRIAGYEVHYGLTSGVYDTFVQAKKDGAHTSTETIKNLKEGNTYYFAVRSRNRDGSLVSAFSNEISVTIDDAPPNRSLVATNAGAQSDSEGDSSEGDSASLGSRIAGDPNGDAFTSSATASPAGQSIRTQTGSTGGRLRSAGNNGVTVALSENSVKADTGADSLESEARGPSRIPSEAGVALVTNWGWTTVTLDNSYDSMVVVTTPSYDLSESPQIVRIRNANGNSFEVGMARVDGGTDYDSTAVPVHYLVVEEGVYGAATHGIRMEAVKYWSTLTDSESSWTGEWQSYANSYGNPVVIGQVMSANDDLRPSSFWARGSSPTEPPDASRLYTGKTVCEDIDSVRDDELIGYIVVEAGTGTLGNRAFQAGVSADSVRGMSNARVHKHQLGNLFSAEVALLSMAGMDGKDGGWPVLVEELDPSGTSIRPAVDEDQLADSERWHTTEQIAYLVLEHSAAEDAEAEGNRTPLVATPAAFDALEGDTVELQIEAIDPDGDALSYWASGLPFGLSIDPDRGLIEGTVDMGQSGIYEVVVEVDDGTSIREVGFDFRVGY